MWGDWGHSAPRVPARRFGGQMVHFRCYIEIDAIVGLSHTAAQPAGTQWDVEHKILESMRHKLNFQRNPRYDYMLPDKPKTIIIDPLLNRPAFGARPVATGPPKSKAGLTAKARTSFVCEPAEVVVREWQPGQTYDMTLQVR
jgi:hypothetical protein